MSLKIAEVVSIDDPDKMGKSRIRVFGIHDDKTNIPDDTLPWAIPFKPTDDPAINKIGSGGNGLLKGSKVFVQSWDDGKGKQIYYIVGSVPKAGDEKKGSTENGSTSIDTSKGSTPTASREKDVNPVIDSPIKDSKKTPGSEKDEGKNIHDETKKKTKQGDKPTIGTEEASTGDVLSTIKKIDPNNSAGSIPNAVNSLSKLLSMDKMNSSNGTNAIVGQVLGQTFNNIIGILGKQLVLNCIKNITSPTNPQNINNNVYKFSENEDVIEVLQHMLLHLGHCLEEKEIIESSTEELDKLKLLIGNDAYEQLLKELKNNTLTKEKLLKIINLLRLKTQNQAMQLQSGTSQDNILLSVMMLLPKLGPLINNTVNTFLPKTVLDQDKIKESLKKYSKNQVILNKKENIIKEIFSGSNSVLSNKIAGISSLKGLFNPTNGKIL